MAHLFVDTPGAQLSKNGEALTVTCDGSRLLEAPFQEIEHVTIVGNVQVTSQAMRALSRRGIRLAVLGHSGTLDCIVTGHTHNHGALRLAQYGKYRDNAFRLNLSKTIVWSKLRNCLGLMRKHRRSHGDFACYREEAALEAEMGRAWQMAGPEALLGCEGSGAHNYYSAFARMIRHDRFIMHGRTRRPPKDPVNAMLSLGYTLLYSEVHGALEGIGLDPQIGFYHEVVYGRASLACDMMEEFRFLVDALVLSVINRRMIDPEEFSHDDKRGWLLNPSGRKVFYAAYDHKMRTTVHHDGQETTYRKLFTRQAEALARVVRDQEYVYVPYEAR